MIGNESEDIFMTTAQCGQQSCEVKRVKWDTTMHAYAAK